MTVDKYPDISDLMGVRYKDYGRNTVEGFDCYGLVIEMYKRFGRNLPDFQYEKTKTGFVENSDGITSLISKHFNEVDAPDYKDILMFLDKKGRAVHVAVCLGKGRLIHCDGNGVSVDYIDTFYYKVWRAYRWQS